MKAALLVTVLVLTAGCTPAYWRLSELSNTCRKPPMVRRTTTAPLFPPTMESDPPLTPGPLVTVTPTRQGDSEE
uniref:Uncharacterized protein n=1 Tax=Chinchilla lanigera TaxID=34839 RepID=A0A8C2UY79_CHILA